MKKIIGCMLFLLVLATALSGCKSESIEVSKGNNKDESEKPIEVEWFIAFDWYSKQWDDINTALDKYITEQTGVKFKITTGNEEKLSALIAGNQLPDMVTVAHSSPQRKMLENSGMLAPLDELIKEYAPDYKIPQSMQEWFRNEDGHFYGYVNYFYPPEELQAEDQLETHTAMYARADIMDQLGITKKDFETKEGTITALKKVKDANIEYNGFTVMPAYFSTADISQFFGGGKREDEEGNLITRPESDLEAITFLNELYREGLMPEEAVTLTEDQIGEKISAGAIFAFTGHRVMTKTKALTESDPHAKLTHIGPIKGDDFSGDWHILPNSLSGWTMTSINANSPYKEEIVKFFEFMTSEEMSLNAWYGPKGITWDYNQDGKVEYLPDVQKEVDEDYNKAELKYGLGNFTWFVDILPVTRTMPEPTNPFDEYSTEGPEYFNEFTYDALALEGAIVEGGTPESAIKAKVDDYTEKMTAEMILAESEEEAEKLYEELIKNQDNLGFKELYDYRNKKFKEAKERLGVEYIWPEYLDEK
ncbi:extracellular solute-binding protein [Bacillus sp. SD088]|uniref:extracellular solute-binding protein n=1 Tax=Bacillus sp. SD088 TaxID=2782012 RepID=UPI001A9770E2|nr:extracellular solute-binding protein [Bacillus sp. SD088]MBO0993196.1 extracellular solute-binding protein [Bacillus sp. SD088]